MLNDFIKNKRVRLNAVVGFYPANAVGDDIEVYADENRSSVRAKLFGLRQQVCVFGCGVLDQCIPCSLPLLLFEWDPACISRCQACCYCGAGGGFTNVLVGPAG